MPAKLIDGKKIADEILVNIAKEVIKLKKRPGLAAILVGDNPASQLYLRLKKEACEKVGLDFHSYFLEKDCPETKVLEVIDFLNNDPETQGILVQLPLPSGFNTDKVIKAIDPKKDVDGFHSHSKFTSPNVLGIIELIKSTGLDLKDKKVAILSNSKLFADPFKKLLPKSIINYSNPKSLITNPQSLLGYDILIIAVGKPNFLKPSMIKKDAILIDVGINKVKGKTVGDIDPACDKIAAWRSPVPGGVGPMTVAMLLTNLVKFVK